MLPDFKFYAVPSRTTGLAVNHSSIGGHAAVHHLLKIDANTSLDDRQHDACTTVL